MGIDPQTFALSVLDSTSDPPSFAWIICLTDCPNFSSSFSLEKTSDFKGIWSLDPWVSSPWLYLCSTKFCMGDNQISLYTTCFHFFFFFSKNFGYVGIWTSDHWVASLWLYQCSTKIFMEKLAISLSKSSISSVFFPFFAQMFLKHIASWNKLYDEKYLTFVKRVARKMLQVCETL